MRESLQASLGTLNILKNEAVSGYRYFPDLYYCILNGDAVSNGGVACLRPDEPHRTIETFLKEHIAQGRPCGESVGRKYPRHFFFGHSLTGGVHQLATTAKSLNKIIRDGLDAPRPPGAKPDGWENAIPPEHLFDEGTAEYEWLYWMVYIGDTFNLPMLQLKRERVEVRDAGETPPAAVASLNEAARFQLFAPTICGTMGVHWRYPGDRAGVHGVNPEWLAVLEAVRDGSLAPIDLFNTAVFHATELAIDALIRQAQDRQDEVDPAANRAADEVGGPGKGMGWQTAKKLAENHCARNPFPGVKALAKIVGCSPSTMLKAIDRSAKLRARRAELENQHKSISTRPMNEKIAASAARKREIGPVDKMGTDEIIQLMIQGGTPERRAALNAMTPEERRELVAMLTEDDIQKLRSPHNR